MGKGRGTALAGALRGKKRLVAVGLVVVVGLDLYLTRGKNLGTILEIAVGLG